MQLSAVAKVVENANPHLASCCEQMAEFVKAWSSGDTAQFLHELDRWSKMLTCSRDIGPVIWSLLAKVPLSEYPDYPVGIVKAIMASPESFCSKGESRLITSADLNSLANTNKENAVAAAHMMRTARKTLQDIEVEKSVRERLYGDVQVRLIMHIHKTNVKGRKVFKSLTEIGIDFSAILTKTAPIQCEQIQLPWSAAATAPTDKSKSASMRQYDVAGDISKATLLEAGFKVGAKVRKGSDEWKIVKIVDGLVSYSDCGQEVRRQRWKRQDRDK